jgi:GNAT superfamily N-acetyltransferase
VLARGRDDLSALVVPRTLEKIDRRACDGLGVPAFGACRVHGVNDPIDVRPVSGKADLNAFIKLPFTLYKDEPLWVAPLIMDIKDMLNEKKNPWFEHAEAEFFLARRGDRVVGRISAHIDRHFNEFQGNDWGLFGWFECEDDPEVAAALYDTAAEWLKARGRDRMVGPFSYTTNDECGVLIDGFEIAPAILEPYTPRFYPGLFDGAGFEKAMDLLMYKMDIADKSKVRPAVYIAAGRVDESSYTFKRFSRRTLNSDVDRFLDIYNESWEKNWGFVPLTEKEVRHYAKTLLPVLDKNWAFVVTAADGDNAGAALTLPDYNQVLKHMNGRLLPFGWAKFLWYRRKIDRVRVFALGVKPRYRTTGLAAKLYIEHLDAAERTGVVGGTMGWILENNRPMNKSIEALGGTVIKRFRLYERML